MRPRTRPRSSAKTLKILGEQFFPVLAQLPGDPDCLSIARDLVRELFGTICSSTGPRGMPPVDQL